MSPRRWRISLEGGLALSAFFAGAPAEVASAEAQVLRPGSAVERKLAAAEVHGYEIEVRAGAFLGIRVEQRGIDVVVTIRDPAGSVLRRHDSPVGDLDIESVSIISGLTAAYRIEVSCFDRLAFPGRYLLTPDGPRPPRAQDETRISAEKALERASVSFDQGTATSYAAAGADYAEAARTLFLD